MSFERVDVVTEQSRFWCVLFSLREAVDNCLPATYDVSYMLVQSTVIQCRWCSIAWRFLLI